MSDWGMFLWSVALGIPIGGIIEVRLTRRYLRKLGVIGDMEQFMSAKIRAAVEEDRANRCADDLYKGCYARGLEDAAKIADGRAAEDMDGGYVMAARLIAEEIRAKAKEAAG